MYLGQQGSQGERRQLGTGIGSATQTKKAFRATCYLPATSNIEAPRPPTTGGGGSLKSQRKNMRLKTGGECKIIITAHNTNNVVKSRVKSTYHIYTSRAQAENVNYQPYCTQLNRVETIRDTALGHADRLPIQQGVWFFY